MRIEPDEPEMSSSAAEEQATYRLGLCRSWTRRFGPRPGSLSRLCAIGDASVLFAGAIGLVTTIYWVKNAPHQMPAVVAGVVVAAIVACHALNRTFLALEKRASIELEGEFAGTPVTSKNASPLYLLAKLVTKPRMRAKHAWVEQRMKLFLARRAHREGQAEIFAIPGLKLGSIHGTTTPTRIEQRR